MGEVVGFGVYFGPKAHRPFFRIGQKVRERGAVKAVSLACSTFQKEDVCTYYRRGI